MKPIFRRIEDWTGKPSNLNRGESVARVAALLFAIAAAVLLFSSCAETTFYRKGYPVARFQGDMTGMEFEMDGDRIRWSGEVNHSNPTLAQGKAASDKIAAGGTAIAVSGLTTLFR